MRDNLVWLRDGLSQWRSLESVGGDDPAVIDWLANYRATIDELEALRALADDFIAWHDTPIHPETRRFTHLSAEMDALLARARELRGKA